jgi:hypothetical protein
MGQQSKKKTVSFSLTDEEKNEVMAGTASHGLSDRNEYLLALMEADRALGLAPVFDVAARRIVLRPNGQIHPQPRRPAQRSK